MDSTPKLSIISPEGVRIFEIKEGALSVPEDGQYKFSNCSYRSENEVEHRQASCCSSRIIKGFHCGKFGIIPLRPEQCAACQDFLTK